MFDITTYLEQKGYTPVHLKENEISIECPFCKKSKNHFQISTDESNASYFCFKCGSRGSWIKLVSKLERIPFNMAREIVYDSINLSVNQKEEYEWPLIELPPESYWTSDAIKYMKERGITRGWIIKFGLYYCSTSKYKNRIIIPIKMNGRIRSFQARAVTKEGLRYLSPPNSPTNRMLYNYDMLNGDKTAILTEGVFDVFKACMEGYWNTVCSFGKKISKQQIELLKEKEINEVLLMYDADLGGETEGFLDELERHFDVGLVPVDEGDPGDMESISDALCRTIRDRREIVEYIIEKRNKKYLLTENPLEL